MEYVDKIHSAIMEIIHVNVKKDGTMPQIALFPRIYALISHAKTTEHVKRLEQTNMFVYVPKVLRVIHAIRK